MGYTWEEFFKVLSNYRPRLYHHIVNQELPPRGSQKCNTNGASKVNPRPSYYGLCIRDR